MTHAPAPLTARWRGAAAGVLTVMLSLLAHAEGGGAWPAGAGIVLVGIMAATLGALAATMPSTANAPGLLMLLASGQVAGHLLLGATAHHADLGGRAAAVMSAAHASAVLVGAVLIAAADRFGRALSRAVRSATTTPRPPVVARPACSRGLLGNADQPLRSALELAASVSHRGPPVSLSR